MVSIYKEGNSYYSSLVFPWSASDGAGQVSRELQSTLHSLSSLTYIHSCTNYSFFFFLLTFSHPLSLFLSLLLSPSFVFVASKQWAPKGDASSSLRRLFPTRRHEGSDHRATRTNWMGQLLGPHYVWYSSSLSTPPFLLLRSHISPLLMCH